MATLLRRKRNCWNTCQSAWWNSTVSFCNPESEVGGTPMSGKKNKNASLSIREMLSYPTTNIKKEQK